MRWLAVMLTSMVLFVAQFSISCRKTEFIANDPFDPVKTLRDHGFTVEPGVEKTVTRNTDGSVETKWQGKVASIVPNDWEVLPWLWRDDIEKNLGSKPNEKFPSSETRKSGEPFEGSLFWTENGISEEMQISLKPDEATKQVEYRISVKGQWVKK